MTKNLIAAVVLVGLLLTGIVAYAVVGPDREECRMAVGTLVDQSLEQDRQLSDAEAKKLLRWPCRFQTKEQVGAIARQEVNVRLPEILAKGLAEAFKE